MAAYEQWDMSKFSCDVLTAEIREWLFEREDWEEDKVNAEAARQMAELHIRLADIVEWIKEGCE